MSDKKETIFITFLYILPPQQVLQKYSSMIEWQQMSALEHMRDQDGTVKDKNKKRIGRVSQHSG